MPITTRCKGPLDSAQNASLGTGPSPVSRPALLACVVACALLLVHAATNTSGFLLVDHANLMIHEVGHVAFSWGGHTLMLLGGTLAQLIVPTLCGVMFMRRGDTIAIACCAFWAFENLLYIAVYLGDARTAALPLVGADESDWTILLSRWGVLHLDRAIAAWVRSVGWIGMLTTFGWLGWKAFTVSFSAERAAAPPRA